MAVGLFVGTGRLSDVGGKPITIAVGIVFVELIVFVLLCTRQRRLQSVAAHMHSIQEIPENRFTDAMIREHHRQAGEPLDSLPLRTRHAVMYTTWGSIAVVILFALPSGLWIAREIGTAFIILISIGLFGFLGTCRLCHPVNRRQYGSVLGLITIAVVVAAIIGRFGGTDNHAVRQVAATDAASRERSRVASRPTIERHLARWLALRANLSTDENPYPLVVAAAQGGGVRAAMWTALAAR